MRDSNELVIIRLGPHGGETAFATADRLDYAQEIGADAVLLPEPYTKEDFCAVGEQYGSSEDFAAFTRDAKQRGISVMIEFCLTDTSPEHGWFKKAQENPSSAYRDYYFFRDGVSEQNRRGETQLLPPNNWEGPDSREAWTLDEASGQFYLSLMSGSRCDLNWGSVKLRADMAKALRFWTALGVTGFYFPNANLIAKTEGLPDCNPPKRGAYFPAEHTVSLPESREYLSELRSKVQGRAAMIFAGSGYMVNAESLCAYTAEGGALNMMERQRRTGREMPDVRDFKQSVIKWQRSVQQGGGMLGSAIYASDTPYQPHIGLGGGTPTEDFDRILAMLDGTLRAVPCFGVAAKGSPAEAAIRKLIKLRRDYPAFTQGVFTAYAADNRQVMLFTREYERGRILVALNLTDKAAKVDVTQTGVGNGVLIYGTHRIIGLEPVFNLLPFEGRIYLIK